MELALRVKILLIAKGKKILRLLPIPVYNYKIVKIKCYLISM